MVIIIMIVNIMVIIKKLWRRWFKEIMAIMRVLMQILLCVDLSHIPISQNLNFRNSHVQRAEEKNNQELCLNSRLQCTKLLNQFETFLDWLFQSKCVFGWLESFRYVTARLNLRIFYEAIRFSIRSFNVLKLIKWNKFVHSFQTESLKTDIYRYI